MEILGWVLAVLVVTVVSGIIAQRIQDDTNAERRASARRLRQEREKELETLEEQERQKRQEREKLEVEEQERKERERAVFEEQERHEKAEANRIALRDSDVQDLPYQYQCIGHPNMTLALRYGIANPESSISLRKTERIASDEDGVHYMAELPDFGNRRVRVVIPPGAEYVKTFYPKSQKWFDEQEQLEEILKDNRTFSLKELATFHVQAVLNRTASR